MTATTNKYGLTYPTGSDAVPDLDTIVQDLAERMELVHGEIGSRVMVVVTADVNQTQRVNYSRSYAALAPIVPVAFATLNSSPAGGHVTVWTTGHDAEGFTLGIRASTSNPFTVNWGCRA